MVVARRVPGVLSQRELDAWRGMLATHARVVAILDDELQEAHDISLVEYEVLMYLLDATGHRLEKSGLVSREPSVEDGRGFYAELTPAGKNLVSAARRTHLAGVRDHFTSKLAAGQLASLAAAWRVVAG